MTDVLVVGSGIAGLTAALEAARGRDVIVIAKASILETNTAWAQGGIAAVLGADDSVASHRDDTLAVGQGLCEPDVVETVTSRGPEAVRRLVSLGAKFDRLPDGTFDLSREGGHSRPRVVHAQGDLTGPEIESALAARARAHPRISVFEHTFVVDLVTDEQGACVGALAWRQDSGLLVFAAPRTVLATGGAGQLYRETTNPEIATADGVAMAFRAGAAVRDAEFVQFHPTTLYVAGAARLLISEVVRGKGAVLVDRTGTPFLREYHPDGDLAPRDVVSRAIVRQMVKTRDTSAYLDLRGVPGDVRKLFPHMAEVCSFFDLDIARDPIPVRPAAHYFVGGVEVDGLGRTTVPGLSAVGEAASSGLHGANRIGSNSLLEGLVLGRIVGEDVLDAAPGAGRVPSGSFRRAIRRARASVRVDLADVAYSVRSLMGRLVGVERSGEGLEEAIERLDAWARYLFAFEFDGQRGFEVANVVTVARLVAEAARFRRESRGTHFRTDFPDRDDSSWRVHTRIVPETGKARVSFGALRGAEATVAPPAA